MPPGQDDNPFGTPRGAWGRQPPTTFGISTPVKRAPRPTNQIRVPTPSLQPRNILTGGLVSQSRPLSMPPPPPPPAPAPAPAVAAEPLPAPAPESAPEPAAEPHDQPLETGSVLARASAAPKARSLPFPPVAGIGVVIAAIVVAGLLLFRRDPEPAAVAAPEIPAPAQPTAAEPEPSALAEPVAAPPVVAAPAAPPAPTVRPPAATSPRRPAVEPLTPITPPPLAAPPIVLAPAPAAPAAAVPPPTDPEAPMTTRLPQ